MIPFRDLIFSFAFYIGKIYYFYNPPTNPDPRIIDPEDEDESNTLKLPKLISKIVKNITSSDFLNQTNVTAIIGSSNQVNENNASTAADIGKVSPIIISVQTFLILTLIFTIFPISLRLLQSIRQFLKIRKRSELINSIRYVLVFLTVLFSFLFALEVGGGWEEMRIGKDQKKNEPSFIGGGTGIQVIEWATSESGLNFGGNNMGKILQNITEVGVGQEAKLGEMGGIEGLGRELGNGSRLVEKSVKSWMENTVEMVAEEGGKGFFWWWAGMAIMSTIVSYAWDLKVEWGFLEKKAKHRYLREQLPYHQPMFYYIAIFLNIFLRFIKKNIIKLLISFSGSAGLSLFRLASSFSSSVVNLSPLSLACLKCSEEAFGIFSESKWNISPTVETSK